MGELRLVALFAHLIQWEITLNIFFHEEAPPSEEHITHSYHLQHDRAYLVGKLRQYWLEQTCVWECAFEGALYDINLLDALMDSDSMHVHKWPGTIVCYFTNLLIMCECVCICLCLSFCQPLESLELDYICSINPSCSLAYDLASISIYINMEIQHCQH